MKEWCFWGLRRLAWTHTQFSPGQNLAELAILFLMRAKLPGPLPPRRQTTPIQTMGGGRECGEGGEEQEKLGGGVVKVERSRRSWEERGSVVKVERSNIHIR